MKATAELAAASREGAGFRTAITASRRPKPWRSQGEAVGPALVSVRPQAGVRSPPKVCEPASSWSVAWGAFPAPSGGLNLFLAACRQELRRKTPQTRMVAEGHFQIL